MCVCGLGGGGGGGGGGMFEIVNGDFYFHKARYLRQGFDSHGVDSTKSPSHIFPSFRGDGLLQYLVLTCTPNPQLTEQGSQACQSDHLPSAEEIK